MHSSASNLYLRTLDVLELFAGLKYDDAVV